MVGANYGRIIITPRLKGLLINVKAIEIEKVFLNVTEDLATVC